MGKGEVELGVYPEESQWKKVIQILTKEFGKPENTMKDYARFNDYLRNEEVEIILLKGDEAVRDIKLHKYLLKHQNSLKEYVALKRKYCFSKREYQKQKHAFLNQIIERL